MTYFCAQLFAMDTEIRAMFPAAMDLQRRRFFEALLDRERPAARRAAPAARARSPVVSPVLVHQVRAGDPLVLGAPAGAMIVDT
jgi:hypothetical protein